MNVIKISFGDWNENFVELLNFSKFDENEVRNDVVSVELDDGDVDVDNEIRNGVVFNDNVIRKDLMLYKSYSYYDEFGGIYLNYDKLKNKIICIDWDNENCFGDVCEVNDVEFVCCNEWFGEVDEELIGKIFISECEKYLLIK
jgi:hypothetical protein